MELLSRACLLLSLTLITCALSLGGIATASDAGDILPPTNLSGTLTDLFVLTWTWDPPEILPTERNCTLKYRSGVQDSTDYKRSTERIHVCNLENLTDEICLEVRSECLNGQIIDSSSTWEKNCISVIKGDLETSVTDFKCYGFTNEPIECSWRPGKRTPPGTNYTLFYRCSNVNHPCKEYLHRDGVVNGCKILNLNNSWCDVIFFLVADSSMKLRPFYTSRKLRDIERPRPPNMINITKFSVDRIYVEWQDSDTPIKDYEVEVKHSKSQDWKPYTVHARSSYTVDSARPDALYTIRVRTRFNKYSGLSGWSDWSSEVQIGEHQNDSSLNIILLLTVPLIVATATILLLVFMKRLQIAIFPPIPDPGKFFRDMVGEQHWIKYGPVNFPNKPVTEETCSVVLVEKESSPQTKNC